MPGVKWNPRYVSYARAHGRDPEGMSAYDRKRWPGGRTTGFQEWMRTAWFDFCALHEVKTSSEASMKLGYQECQSRFNAWLDERAATQLESGEGLIS